MFCKVYQLRSEDGKLSREEARATCRELRLEFARASKIGAPGEFACLRDRNQVEQDRLTSASIRFIRDGGIMIRGFKHIDYPGPSRFFTQSWWCVPIDSK